MLGFFVFHHFFPQWSLIIYKKKCCKQKIGDVYGLSWIGFVYNSLRAWSLWMAHSFTHYRNERLNEIVHTLHLVGWLALDGWTVLRSMHMGKKKFIVLSPPIKRKKIKSNTNLIHQISSNLYPNNQNTILCIPTTKTQFYVHKSRFKQISISCKKNFFKIFFI